jgi:hypothetical protein
MARSPEVPATGYRDTDFHGFPLSVSERLDVSQVSKLLLHVSRAGLPT